jgi:hypothetical protein
MKVSKVKPVQFGKSSLIFRRVAMDHVPAGSSASVRIELASEEKADGEPETGVRTRHAALPEPLTPRARNAIADCSNLSLKSREVRSLGVDQSVSSLKSGYFLFAIRHFFEESVAHSKLEMN